MRQFRLRSALLALALVVPTSAAHPTGTDFDASFEGFRPLPAAPLPGAGAVDLAAIDHDQPPADDGLSGRTIGEGTASFYGQQFNGRRTASGERFDMSELTAAHRTLPFGSKVRVTNAANGRSVVVRINDRGPFHGGRLIDVSRAAAEQLGLIAPGSGRVRLALVD